VYIERLCSDPLMNFRSLAKREIQNRSEIKDVFV
jgi:hypothetical protein